MLIFYILRGNYVCMDNLSRFVISMLENHVHVPFVSDTGTTPPESCIFGQILNIGAVLLLVTIYVRFRQVKMFENDDEIKLNSKWNILGLINGILTGAGISIVGNFQETAILSVHMVGACITFACGTTYICIQTIIFYHFRHIYAKNPECKITPKELYLRIFLAVCCSILVWVAGLFMLLAMLEFKGDNIACWKEEDGGFTFKVVATFAEWALVFCFMIYILSITKEYKLLEFESIRFKNKLSNTTTVSKNKTDENSTV